MCDTKQVERLVWRAVDIRAADAERGIPIHDQVGAVAGAAELDVPVAGLHDEVVAAQA
jgi:hypothetical protein